MSMSEREVDLLAQLMRTMDELALEKMQLWAAERETYLSVEVRREIASARKRLERGDGYYLAEARRAAEEPEENIKAWIAEHGLEDDVRHAVENIKRMIGECSEEGA